jgi:hypothetical protein
LFLNTWITRERIFAATTASVFPKRSRIG